MKLQQRLARLRGDLCRRAEHMVRARPKRGMGFPLPEDLAQMVLTRLLSAYGERGLDEFDEGKLYAYAYTSLHRIVIDEGMRRVPDLGSADDPIESTLVADPAPAEQGSDERAHGLEQCLGELEPAARAFLVKSIELESAPLAQKETGWPPGGASNACHRGRKLLAQLRVCLEKRGVEGRRMPQEASDA